MKWLTDLWRSIAGRRADFYEVELHGPGWFRLASGSVFYLEAGMIVLRTIRARMAWGPFKTRAEARRFRWRAGR